ncbi:translation initiation factor [Stieleria sp. TO1_6]|uniref:translation initiation factor n=1 Tax=Stieleria tagensis TaxID=2956795 RepID=UPI00209B075A|nr:translation initiation factor [Stieleria tagensis]MCO8125015.1 translation initiation factor [Stieleria tagensis]
MSRLFAGTPFDIPPKCDDCGQLESECICSAAEKAAAETLRAQQAARLPPDQQTARISVQKRKGGRTATVIEGLSATANDLPELLGRLQAACGTGGTTKPKQDLIELQGDHAEQVQTTLAEIGFRTKPSRR